MCGALIKSEADTHTYCRYVLALFLFDFIGKLKDESRRETEVIPQRTRARHFCGMRPPCHLPGSYRIPTPFFYFYFLLFLILKQNNRKSHWISLGRIESWTFFTSYFTYIVHRVLGSGNGRLLANRTRFLSLSWFSVCFLRHQFFFFLGFVGPFSKNEGPHSRKKKKKKRECVCVCVCM